MHTDTVNIALADNLGAWYGNGMGVSYQLLDTVLRNVTIDRGKDISVSHIMRVDVLPEIEQVGIIFTPRQ